MSARSVEFEKADDGSFISHTRHHQEKDGEYKEPSTHTHNSVHHAARHLKKVFGHDGNKVAKRSSRKSSRRG